MTLESQAARTFARLAGSALMLGGVLVALLNLVLTPLLPVDAGSVAVLTSTALAIRLPLAATAVALITLGCAGLYLAEAHRLRFGALAFAVCAAGGFMMFAAEAVQVTLVRDLAFAIPDTYAALEDSGDLGRYDIAFAVAVSTYALGWLAVAIVSLRSRIVNRRGPAVLILGLLLAPALGGALGRWGAVVGAIVLGAGWTLLGLDLRRLAAADRGGAGADTAIIGAGGEDP